MSQNNTLIVHVGLDVAKLSLQLHIKGRFYSLSNNPKGHVQLLKLLRTQPGAHLVCEATGGYEEPVVRLLHAADLPVSVLEAGRVRHFARAQGLRAKTDPIDAAVLSDYGRAFQPAPTLPVSPRLEQLANLAQRRRQLIDLKSAERNHLEHYGDPFRLRQARQLAKLLEKQIAQCDQAIVELVSQDPHLARQAQRLQAIPGVGPVVSVTLLAEMPELGKLNKQTAAALAGVAPYNHDSGSQQNARRCAGGRKTVRTALYMATLSAVRYDPILKAFYQRLLAAGKKPLVAMTACMRKLIILINHLLKNDNFQLAH